MSAPMQLVTFRLGAEVFGVPIQAIQEVVRLPEITPLPEAPAFVEGVINLRGRILPVLDLGRRLRLPDRPRTRATRVLVAEAGGQCVGLIVDAVCEVMRLAAGAIEPAPPMVSGIGVDYVTGVGKLRDQLLVLLDLGRAIHLEDLRHAEEGGAEAAPATVPAA